MHTDRAIPVKVAAKPLPVFPFSGLLEGCKSHKTHRFENGGTNQIRKKGKREAVLLQPLPESLYLHHMTMFAEEGVLSSDPRPSAVDLM